MDISQHVHSITRAESLHALCEQNNFFSSEQFLFGCQVNFAVTLILHYYA